MRICMVTPTATGGHAQYSRELLRALAAGAPPELEIELVAREDLEDRFRGDEYPIHAVLPRLRHKREFRSRAQWAWDRACYYHRQQRALLKWLDRNACDAVHFQEICPWLHAGMARELAARGIRQFFTLHNLVPHAYPHPTLKGVIDRGYRTAVAASERVFVHSAKLQHEAAALYGAPLDRFAVTPHGVWTIPAAKRRQAPSRPRLLFFGNIRANKGLHHLLDAKRDLPEFSLAIAGAPSEKEYFEREIVPRVERLRAEGHDIEMETTFIDEERLCELFASASMLVLPYRGFYSQSGVLFYAIAFGVPVVASPEGALGETVAGYQLGSVFRGEAPRFLIEAIRACAALRPEEIERAMERAREEHSWAGAADLLIENYLANARSPHGLRGTPELQTI